VVFSLALSGSGGCSGRPSAPPGSDIDPASAGAKAVADYDANKDGKLNEAELQQCPSLRSALKRVDKDGDSQLTAEEISSRIQKWADSGTIVLGAPTHVELDGKPLEGAAVTFEPEAFLGASMYAAKGLTNKSGQVVFEMNPKIGLPGVFPGFYRVRVSKDGGGVSIPAKFNAVTELGCEVADDIDVGMIRFELRSK
jgi:hypothetical protein